MNVAKTSMFSGVKHVAAIDVTPEQLDRWKAGELIQNAMPNLTPEEREFIMTGVTPKEWDAEFGTESADINLGVAEDDGEIVDLDNVDNMNGILAYFRGVEKNENHKL